MNFDRNWTIFALDAEVEAFGTSRIASAHNKLRAEVAALNQPVKLSEWQELVAERDRLRELLSICLQFWLDDSDPDELTEFVTKTKAALGGED